MKANHNVILQTIQTAVVVSIGMLWEFESKSQLADPDKHKRKVVSIGMLWEFESKSQLGTTSSPSAVVVSIGMLWEFESKSQQ